MFSFECKRCGICCSGGEWLRNLVQPSDVEKWKSQGRDDILKYICPTCNTLIDPDKSNAPWMNEKCPFLELDAGKAKCRIYEVRPQTCRLSPLVKCNNPKCSKNFHFHEWLWIAKCPASKKLRRDIEQVLESQIKIQGKTISELSAQHGDSCYVSL